MIIGLKYLVLLVYCNIFFTEAIVTRITVFNESTTSKPFRPRLRWPGKSISRATTTKVTTPVITKFTRKFTTPTPIISTTVTTRKNIIPVTTTTTTTTRPTTTTTESTVVPEQFSEIQEETTVLSIVAKEEDSTFIPFSDFAKLFTPHVLLDNASLFPTELPVSHDFNVTSMPHSSDSLNNMNNTTIPSTFDNPFAKFFSTESRNEKSFSVEQDINDSNEDDTSTSISNIQSTKNVRLDNKNIYLTSTDGDVSTVNSQPELIIIKTTIESIPTRIPPVKSKPKVNSSTNTVNEIQVSTGGTYVYVVGIIGIIPTVGVFMWCIRQALSRPQKTKELPTTTTYSTVDLPSNESRELTTDVTDVVTGKDQADDNYQRTEVEPSSKKSFQILEYPRQNLDLLEILGEGNFGVVWKAEAKNTPESRRAIVVAVKTVKENASYKERQELLRELSIMQHFHNHPNVVRLLGCCTETEPYFLIMEFVKNGKLQSFLREHRSKRKYYNNSSQALNSKDLTLFSYQVASGMEYISSIGVIHRDLAARNVLIDHNNICKIADFGLSRYSEDGDCGMYEQKTKGALPIRWMAPESLYFSLFTTKSDVWAFGILLWEIVTLGSTPYPGMSAREVIHHVQKGYVMECPNHCHPELYSLMCTCWASDANSRPSFTVLCRKLENSLAVQTGYVDLDHFPENSYYNLYQSPGEKV